MMDLDSMLAKWQVLGEGQDAIRLLMQPLDAVNLVAAAQAAQVRDLAKAVEICVTRMPKAWQERTADGWQDLTDSAGKPVPFDATTLRQLLGVRRDLLKAFLEYVTDMLSDPESEVNPPMPTTPSPS